MTASDTSAIRLRPLGADDATAAWSAHDLLAPGGTDFLLDARRGEPWPSYLRRLDDERVGVGLPQGWVPATFLVAEVAGTLVGRLSVRHDLNVRLAVVGGHIAYAVLPAHRRRGYATAMLRHGLGIARSVGVDAALLTCDDDNTGSIRTIERCGGELQGVVADPRGGRLVRRYLVPTTSGSRREPPQLPGREYPYLSRATPIR